MAGKWDLPEDGKTRREAEKDAERLHQLNETAGRIRHLREEMNPGSDTAVTVCTRYEDKHLVASGRIYAAFSNGWTRVQRLAPRLTTVEAREWMRAYCIMHRWPEIAIPDRLQPVSVGATVAPHETTPIPEGRDPALADRPDHDQQGRSLLDRAPLPGLDPDLPDPGLD